MFQPPEQHSPFDDDGRTRPRNAYQREISYCPHLSSEAKSNLPKLLRGDLSLAGTGEMNRSLVCDWTLLLANSKSPMNEHDLEHPCRRW